MKKRVTTIVLTIILSMTFSITALAAPKTMPDGQLFDAEYYAEHNSDVVKALGSKEADLYKHYVDYGKAEGRLPYADAPKPSSGTTNAASNTPASTTAVSTSKPATATSNTTSQTVYITKTGSKYHNSGCRSLKKSKIAISLDDAKAQGYEACKLCH